jgi:cardiolipin synthase
VPKHSDTQSVDLASRATFSRLLPAGVRIFQHHPVVHTKALLVDDGFVSLGSYNIDHRSLVYNLELVVNALDREHNAQVAAMLEADMAASQEIHWDLSQPLAAFAHSRTRGLRLPPLVLDFFHILKCYLNSAMTGA